MCGGQLVDSTTRYVMLLKLRYTFKVAGAETWMQLETLVRSPNRGRGRPPSSTLGSAISTPPRHR